MKKIDLTILKGAIFSDDGKYRYTLWRVWNPLKDMLLYIGLNPSTANGLSNDPTVTRNIRRAYDNGFGGLFHGNLHGLISSNPSILLTDPVPVGELNDYYLKQMIEISKCQLCGWGSFGPVKKRAPIVLAMCKEPYCLGFNKDGQPKHPLYVSYDVPMIKITN